MQNTYVEYEGIRSPFRIQQRCPVRRMTQPIGQVFGINPKYFNVMRHDILVTTIDMFIDGDLWLLEECEIKDEDILVVFAKPNWKNPFLENSIEISFVHNNKKIYNTKVT